MIYIYDIFFYQNTSTKNQKKKYCWTINHSQNQWLLVSFIVKRITNKDDRHKTKINYSLSLFSPSMCFLTLLDCHPVRELMSGDVVPKGGRSGVSPWSDLPLTGQTEVPPWSDLELNYILYHMIPFSIFAYSSNIFITRFVRMGSTLVEGTLKYSRRDSYCVSDSRLPLTI